MRRLADALKKVSHLWPFALLIVVSLAEVAFSKTDLYQSFLPGGYAFFQKRIQGQMGADAELPIRILDAASIPSKKVGEVTLPDPAEFLPSVKNILEREPAYLVVDLDLIPNPVALAAPDVVQVDLLKKLNGLAQKFPGTKIALAGSSVVEESGSGLPDKLQTGAVTFPDQAVEHGYFTMYPVSETLETVAGKVEVRFLVNQIGPPRQSPSFPGLESEREVSVLTSNGNQEKLEMRSINYGAIPALIAQARPVEQARSLDLKGKIVILGDLEKPYPQDRTSIPGAEKRAALLLLASAIFTHVSAPISVVAEGSHLWLCLGIGLISYAIKRGFANLATRFLEHLKHQGQAKEVEEERAEKWGEWAGWVASMAFVLWLFMSFLPSAHILLEGFVSNVIFLLLETILHSASHDLSKHS